MINWSAVVDEDKWANKVIRKHMRRSGIRRLYCFDDLRSDGRLKLEFVIRGKVIGHLPLWRIPPMIDDI